MNSCVCQSYMMMTSHFVWVCASFIYFIFKWGTGLIILYRMTDMIADFFSVASREPRGG